MPLMVTGKMETPLTRFSFFGAGAGEFGLLFAHKVLVLSGA
jgi:hypothetical protein